MTRTIVALYDDLSAAQRVVDDLVNAGLKRENISIIANNATGDFEKRMAEARPTREEHVGPVQGGTFGAVVGAVAGAALSLSSLAIPGIGPVIAAGPLAVGLTGAVTGAVAGGVTGGIIGTLLNMGVSNEDAQYYAEGIRRGGILVAANADDEWVSRAEEIMDRYSPIDVERRADQWKITGWKDFNAEGTPYTAEDLARERDNYQKFESDMPTLPTHPRRIRSYDQSDTTAHV